MAWVAVLLLCIYAVHAAPCGAMQTIHVSYELQHCFGSAQHLEGTVQLQCGPLCMPYHVKVDCAF